MSLQTTTKYEQFQLLDFNRDVTKSDRLTASMKKHGFIPAYPLHVIKENGKLRIKGGHHRFDAASKLGIPVHYVVCDDTASVVELEQATRRWTLADYLKSWSRSGDTDYSIVAEFHTRTGIGLGLCISMFVGEVANNNNYLARFKAGEFIVKDNDLPERVAGLMVTLKRKGCRWAHEAHCITALSRLVIARQCSLDRLTVKINKYSGPIRRCASIAAYTEMFEEIYNHKCPTRVNIAFLTNEVIRKRSACAKKDASGWPL